MKREWPWLTIAVVLALLGLGAWLVSATEWVEETETLPMRGEAAHKSYYAAAQALRGIGAQVVERDNLDTLPPPGATLVLESNFWSMFPKRSQKLRDWVEQGGHLVVPRYLVRDEELGRWLPIKFDAVQRKPRPEADAASDPQAAVPTTQDEPDEDPAKDDEDRPPPRVLPGRKLPYKPAAMEMPCTLRHEPPAVPATFEGHRDYRVCGGGNEHFIVKPGALQWSLDGRHGPKTARVSVGLGSVAVLDVLPSFNNRGFLHADNGLAFLAALRMPVGEQVWFVAGEKRPPLLVWLWQQGAVAVVLGAVALAAALWRNGARFGPRAAPTAMGRRSVTEQIRGTAEFIWQRGPKALHAAQLRALDDVAVKQVRGYARLARSGKAEALAKATGLDAGELGRALDGRIERPRAAWPPVLALLDAVRRQLLARRHA